MRLCPLEQALASEARSSQPGSTWAGLSTESWQTHCGALSSQPGLLRNPESFSQEAAARHTQHGGGKSAQP